MRRLLLSGGLAAALALPGALPTPATAAPEPAPTGGLTGKHYTVTLITGDVVTVRMTRSGCPLVAVTPATPSRAVSKSCGPDGRVRVVPADAAPLLGRTLDPALFDVTGLINQGYDDARATETPLIVRYRGAQKRAVAPQLRGARTLASLNAVAGRQPKTARLALTGKLALAGRSDVRQIQLDRRVRATTDPTLAPPPADSRLLARPASAGSALPAGQAPAAAGRGLDVNLAQVQAPAAWRAGYTGKGVRVAVLDSGVDATHPDLAGRIGEQANFTAEPDPTDGLGHGTHVAATIAGTGAAAGGARRGVAYDASLLIGKVLDREGDGTESQVIAGMEWAAPRAKVVNLSLGGWEPSDGSDPLSQAVDALSREHRTLFVVSAGNSGPYERMVAAPAAAATALTVGAVDAGDRLAAFSSRGPLFRTNAVKPELVAPGVDIVAARAAGTSMGRPIDSRYTASSGTSMAAPHVAGAAALLAQRHPDWTGDQLKAALIGAVDPTRPADPADGSDDILGGTGAGRLNAARALAGPVAAQGLIDLGSLPDPQTGTAEAKLGWTNPGTAAATLALDVALHDRTGKPVPATLSTGSVTLAPGASGAAVLRVDRSALAGRRGFVEGMVTARTGTTTVRTPVTFTLDPPRHTLTVTATTRPGTPLEHVFAYLSVIDLNDPTATPVDTPQLEAGEPVTLTVPAGRYAVMGVAGDFDPETYEQTWTALAGDPDVEVNGDTTVVLDAAAARKVTATVEGVDTRTASTGVMILQRPEVGLPWWNSAMAWHDNTFLDMDVYAQPTDGVGVGTLRAFDSFNLLRPGDEPSPYAYDLLIPLGDRIPADPAVTVTRADQAELARIDQRYHRPDLPDGATRAKRYGLSADGMFFGESMYENLPAHRVDYVSAGVWWLDEAFYDGIVPRSSVSAETFHLYRPGETTEKIWGRQPLRPDWYDDAEPSGSWCQPEPITRTRGVLSVSLVDLADQHQRYDCLDTNDDWVARATRTLTLSRDGTRIGEASGSRGQFAVPSAPGTYRLGYDLRTGLDLSSRVTTAWTFRSAGPRGTQSAPIPLLSVDYALPLDAANHPVAGAATFTVRQTLALASRRIQGFRLWTSTDDGGTWTPVPANAAGGDRYTATLPGAASGQAVSLRVDVTADGGGRLEQDIIRAYR